MKKKKTTGTAKKKVKSASAKKTKAAAGKVKAPVKGKSKTIARKKAVTPVKRKVKTAAKKKTKAPVKKKIKTNLKSPSRRVIKKKTTPQVPEQPQTESLVHGEDLHLIPQPGEANPVKPEEAHQLENKFQSREVVALHSENQKIKDALARKNQRGYRHRGLR